MYRKRQKVASACEYCRSKKTKCDGARPVCRTCAEHGQRACLYESSFTTKPKESESIAAAGASRQRDHQPTPSISVRSESSVSREPHAYIDAASLKADFRGPSTKDRAPGFVYQENNAKDAEAMTGIVGDQPPGHEFFGSSNASLFMKQIKSIIDARWGRDQSDPQPHPPSRQSRQETHGSAIFDNPQLYFMPPRTVADNFLKCYWDQLWAVFPIHNKISFENSYSSIWSSSAVNIKDELVFYTMLNLVFGLGSQFSDLVRPDQRKEVGQIFWNRAHTLFDPQVSKTASVEGVQCLLLMAIFLQSTRDSYRCWMVTGSAVRMAQSLGLHLPETSKRISNSETDCEIARRIWHGCVFLDRLLAMTFGRPGMTSNNSSKPVPLPSMIDDEFFDTQKTPAALRPDGKPAIVAFFIKTLELYSMVNDILQEFYVSNADWEKKHYNPLISILRFDDRLTAWAASLPKHLQYSTFDGDENDMYRRQRIVLRIRYLHVQILLFRPVLANVCLKLNPNASTQLITSGVISQTLDEKCAEICFEAAHEVINLFYEHINLDNVTGPVPAWWFAVLFIYTAATVLLAERLQPIESRKTAQNRYQAQLTWDRTIQLLQAYSRVAESAQRCLVAVQILSAKVSGNIPVTHVEQDRQDLTFGTDATGPSSTTLGPLDTSSYEDLLQPIDLGSLDFDIDDMFWLNSSAAEYLF